MAPVTIFGAEHSVTGGPVCKAWYTIRREDLFRFSTIARDILEDGSNNIYLTDFPKPVIKYLVDWMSNGGRDGDLPYPKDIHLIVCVHVAAKCLKIRELIRRTAQDMDRCMDSLSLQDFGSESTESTESTSQDTNLHPPERTSFQIVAADKRGMWLVDCDDIKINVRRPRPHRGFRGHLQSVGAVRETKHNFEVDTAFKMIARDSQGDWTVNCSPVSLKTDLELSNLKIDGHLDCRGIYDQEYPNHGCLMF